jgi:hypothetical protein
MMQGQILTLSGAQFQIAKSRLANSPGVRPDGFQRLNT